MREQAETIVDVLCRHAAARPGVTAFHFLAKGEVETETLTFAELCAAAKEIASGLLRREAPGSRLILCLDSGLDFIKTFLGCMFAAMVPVPVDLPRPGRSCERLGSIVGHSESSAYITGLQEMERVARLSETCPGLAKLRAHLLEEVASSGDRDFLPKSLPGQDTAFIQYTSGSTSFPKGVVVSHRNLIFNQRQIQAAFGHDEHTKFVGWLPMFHDMGLVGNVLQPIFLGIECTLMPPGAFVQRPVRWLKAISQYRATTSGGPNFGFDHCVNRVSDSDIDTLDLSSWRVAFNGAEPVRAPTLRSFAAKFERAGFSPSTWLPCYGLAEATLLVAGCAPDATPVTVSLARDFFQQGYVVPAFGTRDFDVCELVSSGRPAILQEVKIVDPEKTSVLDEAQIGEIWISGPNVASSYFENTLDTDVTFRNRLPDDDREYLRTGDLGFIMNGELYVTGRRKDLIIIRGRNVYPQDVELLTSQVSRFFHANRCAAFAVDVLGEESFVIVQEVSRTRPDGQWITALQAARSAVIQHCETTPYDILLVTPGSIPTTSSGKIRRRSTRDAYLNCRLEIIAGLRKCSVTSAASDHHHLFCKDI